VGEYITGYGPRTNFTQPFAAEDIVMLYDGYCASTCTIFSEFMRLQGGVKSIAYGGRPNSDSSTPIIQGVGGVKGANNYPYGYIVSLATAALGFNVSAAQSSLLKPLTNNLAVRRTTGKLFSSLIFFDLAADSKQIRPSTFGTTFSPIIWRMQHPRNLYTRLLIVDCSILLR
jgi:hypothetical protein